jgi:hypothetical protein
MSTSGAQLLPQTAISTLINSLLPLTTILTPNLPEAKLLLQTAGVEIRDPENVDDIVAMAHKIQGLGPRWVLLKGGHLPLTRGRLVGKAESEKEVVLNVLVGESGLTILESEYLRSENTHGTGCSLACKSILTTPRSSGYSKKTRTDESKSCDSMQPCFWDEHDQGGEEGESLRGSRHQNECEHGRGKRTNQPLSFNLHTAVYTVRELLLSGNRKLTMLAVASSRIYSTEMMCRDPGDSTPSTNLSSGWQMARCLWTSSDTT